MNTEMDVDLDGYKADVHIVIRREQFPFNALPRPELFVGIREKITWLITAHISDRFKYKFVASSRNIV